MSRRAVCRIPVSMSVGCQERRQGGAAEAYVGRVRRGACRTCDRPVVPTTWPTFCRISKIVVGLPLARRNVSGRRVGIVQPIADELADVRVQHVVADRVRIAEDARSPVPDRIVDQGRNETQARAEVRQIHTPSSAGRSAAACAEAQDAAASPARAWLVHRDWSRAERSHDRHCAGRCKGRRRSSADERHEWASWQVALCRPGG